MDRPQPSAPIIINRYDMRLEITTHTDAAFSRVVQEAPTFGAFVRQKGYPDQIYHSLLVSAGYDPAEVAAYLLREIES